MSQELQTDRIVRGREAVVLRFKEVIEVLGIDEVKVERVVDTGN